MHWSFVPSWRPRTDLEYFGRYEYDLYQPFVGSGHPLFSFPPQVSEAYDRAIQAFARQPYDENILAENLLKNHALKEMVDNLSPLQIYRLLKELRHATSMAHNAPLLRAYIYVTLRHSEAMAPERFNWIPTVLPILKDTDASKSPLTRLLLQEFRFLDEILQCLSTLPVEKLIDITPMGGAALARETALYSINDASNNPLMSKLFTLSLAELERQGELLRNFTPLWWNLEKLAAPYMTGVDPGINLTSNEYQRFRTFFIALYGYLAPYNEHTLLLSLDLDPFSIEHLNSLHGLLLCTWMSPLLQERDIKSEALTMASKQADAVLNDPDMNIVLVLKSFEVLLRIYQAKLPPSLARETVAGWINRAAQRTLAEDTRIPKLQPLSNAKVFDLLAGELRLPECLDIWLDLVPARNYAKMLSNFTKVSDWRVVATLVRRLGWNTIDYRRRKQQSRPEDTDLKILLDYLTSSGKQANMSLTGDIITIRLPRGQRVLSRQQKWTLIRFLLLVHYDVPWWVTPPTLVLNPKNEEECIFMALDQLVVPNLVERYRQLRFKIQFLTPNRED